MTEVAAPLRTRSLGELTHAVFGEALSFEEAFARMDHGKSHGPGSTTTTASPTWLGSVGYERYKENKDFARRLREAGVDRLVDVRELPMSRRRGYAKTALDAALGELGIEYVHVRALGNPKPFRDLYKSGRIEEGRERYKRHLLSEGRSALQHLADLLSDGKRSALMCVEHEPKTCHRTVIVEALREELLVELDVAELV